MDIRPPDYLPHRSAASVEQPHVDDSTEDTTETETEADAPRDQDGRPAGLRATVGSALSGAIATVMGLIPHLLHHVSLFAGAALITGAAGNLLFGVVGLLFSIPLLRRLHRRYGTWRAPAAALGVFTVMFTLSAFVLGPALSGSDDRGSEPARPSPGEVVSPDEHANHHGE